MSPGPPVVVLVVDGSTLPHWQGSLYETLRSAVGARAFVLGGDGSSSRLGPAARAYARLDAWASQRGEPDGTPAVAKIDAVSCSLSDAIAGASVVVDLTRAQRTDALPTSSLQILTVSPQAVDSRVLLALLVAGARSIPVTVEVRCSDAIGTVERSNIAVPRLSLKRSSDRVGWRTAELVRRAIDRLIVGERIRERETSTRVDQRTTEPRFLDVARLLGAAALSMARIVLMESEWRVAWGYRESRDPFVLPARLNTLEAPAGHFFADPFLAQEDGRTFVFFEDFDSAAGRASIGVTELGVDSDYVTVLSAAYHLSYPFVFSHESTWYMVPETAEAERITLYRCIEFPHRWVEDSILLDGVAAYDSTIVWFDDRWWLFYSAGTKGSSSADELHLRFGATLRGPFVAHPENPVASDAIGARPAGRIINADGRLLRPGQDGAREYGAGIVINEIVSLSVDSYEEREVARVHLPVGRNVRGLHTIDTTTDLIVVDTKHRVPRRAGLVARVQRFRRRTARSVRR